MAHYHYAQQKVAVCDSLGGICDIKPRYSSFVSAEKYRGQEPPADLDIKRASAKASDGNGDTAKFVLQILGFAAGCAVSIAELAHHFI